MTECRGFFSYVEVGEANEMCQKWNISKHEVLENPLRIGLFRRNVGNF